MTTFNCSLNEGVKIEFHERDNHVAVTRNGNGVYIKLSDRDLENLALDMLRKRYTVAADGKGFKIQSRRPLARVGEFYRVKGVANMDSPWRGSPIVKVVNTSTWVITVETIDGEQTTWSSKLEGLEGPLNVRTMWTEEA